MESLSKGTKVGLAVGGALAATWAASSMPAAAADLRPVVVQPPKIVPAFDPWNAFSIGFGAVGTIATTPTDSYSFDGGEGDDIDVFASNTLASRGIGATIEIGKDFHIAPSFVFGIYGDLRLGSQTGSSSTKGTTNFNFNQVDSEFTLKNGATVAARAGFLVNPSTLVYGLVGYSWNQYTSRIVAGTDYAGPATGSKSGTLGGLTVGIGGEVMLNTWLSLKGEYRFTHLGKVLGADTYNSGAPWAGQSHDNTDLHQVRVVLSAKFGG